MTAPKPDGPDFAPERLDERIVQTLQGLGGRIAFSGLRRALGAHPESLSRALRRLEREGRIERADGGYRLLGPAPAAPRALAEELRPVAQVDLPPGLSSRPLLTRLAGHWFGGLRWVGEVDGPRGPLLAWARRDGTGHVLLGVERGVLRVFVPEDEGVADAGDAEEAAYELLLHAVEALRSGASAHAPPVALFGDRAPTVRFASVDN